MKKANLKLPEIKLVGIKVRTNNSDEMDPKKAKIGATIDHYFKNNLAAKISGRVNPGTTYCVYAEYESDEYGEYTYFVGEEVDYFGNIGPGLAKLVIPSSSYTKFEYGPGEMPMLCIDAWKEIWQMKESDLSGKRNYIADFEIYDERAKDPTNTIFDLYIGVQK